MAQSAVVLHCDEFAHAFLPQPVSTYPQESGSRHIFSQLEHADASSDYNISELLVCSNVLLLQSLLTFITDSSV